MPFCTNCGQEIQEGAKFCAGCGTPTENSTNTKRKSIYEGEIHKCPNCGEVLKSFELNCSACGYELRGARASSAVKEFALKLEAIESRREYEKPRGFFAAIEAQQRVSKTDEQKISLIKSFSVPNTKEDMLEFMILATSNVDMSMYESTNAPTAGVKAMNEAWHAKIKQIYAKAKNAYGTDPEFSKIQELYNSCFADITRRKKKKIFKNIILYGGAPIALVVLCIFLLVLNWIQEPKEIDRLESILVETQEALNNGEYKLALNYADSIDYQRFDIEMEREWDIQREYWVEKVLEEAAENGVDLEYTPTPDIDRANDELSDSEDNNGGFVEGFKEGVQPGLDAAKENIDEFNRILNGEESDSSGSIE